jgi:motility quorum-sensing regulator/GCU-specific mRNA interferase toxin
VEKQTPHCDLAVIQAQVARLGPGAFTKTALDGGRDMGLTSREMLAVITGLTRRHFYKSMTTYADHSIWQDVYYSPTPVGSSELGWVGQILFRVVCFSAVPID